MNSLPNNNKPAGHKFTHLNADELFELGRSVNHDVRAQLRHIKAFHSILMEGQSAELSEEHQRCHAYVMDACDRADQQIQSLADYFKLCAQVPVIEQLSLQTVFESIQSEFSSADLADCHFEPPNKVVETDANLFSLILYELVDNALKFHPIDTAPHQRQVRVSVKTVDGVDHLCVEDNGIGIEDRYKDQVCQAFRQLNTKDLYLGVGMGLARVDMAARKLQLSFCIVDNNPGVSFQLRLHKP